MPTFAYKSADNAVRGDSNVGSTELTSKNDDNSVAPTAGGVKIVLNHDGKQCEIGFEEMQSLYKYPTMLGIDSQG